MWKTVSFNSKYEVNEQGIIRKITKKGYFYPKYWKDKDGYLSVSLNLEEGGKKKYRVHRVVALTFIPNPDNKSEVNHINSIRDDNRVENLEWATRSENEKHAFRDGRWPELREKARENLLKYAVSAISKPVNQYDLEGNLIATYPSMSAAAREIGTSHTTISRACEKGGTVHGFKWELAQRLSESCKEQDALEK